MYCAACVNDTVVLAVSLSTATGMVLSELWFLVVYSADASVIESLAEESAGCHLVGTVYVGW